MKAALAALNFVATFAAASTIDTSDLATSRRAKLAAIKSFNTICYLGFARGFFFVKCSRFTANGIAQRLGLETHLTDAPRDEYGYETFAVAGRYAAGLRHIEMFEDYPSHTANDAGCLHDARPIDW